MNSDVLKKLRTWFTKNAAQLPWRPLNLNNIRDPYSVWISETMLQQTQVSTVRDYYIRWMHRFPNIESLAKAEESEIFKYWQGLGYYSRVKNLQKTARLLVKEASSEKVSLPDTRIELEKLPGIGAYTAGAILSLAYHKREAILDGNLVRILSRFYELDFLPTDKKRKEPKIKSNPMSNKSGKEFSKSCSEIYWNYARAIADSSKAYMHNEALMELGRTLCKVKNPNCSTCPLVGGCRAFKDGRAMEFPPAKKHLQKEWHGTALVVESADGKYLAVSAGCTFLANQLVLPHFETERSATAGIPLQAEDYVNADDILSIKNCGKFRHNITIHKIECDVLYIKIKTSEPTTMFRDKKTKKVWIPKAKAMETFVNSFSIKALKKIL